MKIYKNYILLSFISTIIWSCSKESEPKVIETELLVHFEEFVNEAELRGVEIDLSQLDIGGYIRNIEDNGIIGQCISYSDGSNDVVVDERNWNRLNNIEKEYVVFHELGHCILERSHDDTQDQNGVCQSIMHSGEGQCQSRYNLNNRPELLEELFKN